jgi:predicted nucleic acid-binding protein
MNTLPINRYPQLENDVELLQRRGVSPGPNGYTTQQLVHELARRGWRWVLDPEYARAEKDYTPSRSVCQAFDTVGSDPIANLITVLAEAIRFDDEHGTTPWEPYRADIVLRRPDHRIVALVEVRSLPHLTPEQAVDWRRFLLADGLGSPEYPFFLLISPEDGYLWDQRQDLPLDAPPTASFPMRQSNFVLEIALGQEESVEAERIIAHAESGRIELAMPSIALTEPISTITGRNRNRARLASSIQEQTRELERSLPHQDVAATFAPLGALLASVGDAELALLESTIERLLRVVTIIPLDADVVRQARMFRIRHELALEDAIIYAAVVRHLSANPRRERHIFGSRNWKDFGRRQFVSELHALDCDFVRGFGEAASRIPHALA